MIDVEQAHPQQEPTELEYTAQVEDSLDSSLDDSLGNSLAHPLESFDANSLDVASVDVAFVRVQVHKLEGRRRQIEASIHIQTPIEHLWNILTDYEKLADFIPNLKISRLVDHPQGQIRLEQVGSQQFLKVNFSARVVLDMQEDFPNAIYFQIVEGDFKHFAGAWKLEPEKAEGVAAVKLTYQVEIWPKVTMPIKIVENRLKTDLSQNLRAIHDRAITTAQMVQQ